MLKEIKKYIKDVQDRISGIVPEEHLESVMQDVSDVVCKNWVDGDDYKLNKTQIMSLVRKNIAKKYGNN